MDIIIRCKSVEQAVEIARHFIGSRPDEEFLNERLAEADVPLIENAVIDMQKDLIIINI